jgi:hypothetical protein
VSEGLQVFVIPRSEVAASLSNIRFTAVWSCQFVDSRVCEYVLGVWAW